MYALRERRSHARCAHESRAGTVRVASGRAPRPPVARGAAVSLETTAGRGGLDAVLDAISGRHGPRGRLRA